MGVAPPATLGGFAPAATHIITHAIIYALITVTNNYTTKKTRVGQGAKPPKRVAKQRAERGGRRLVLPEKQYQHHNRHRYCQHQV